MGAISDKADVECGVMQRSILGPLLFVLFVNDLPNYIDKCKIVLYADDTVLMFLHSDVNTIQQHFDSDLENASRWLCNNKLHLNINKTKFMIFGTHKCLHKTPVVHVKLNGVELEHVYQYKYLGLLFDPALTWDKHADVLCAKLAQRIGVLRWVRDYLDLRVATMMYNTLILAIFDYCNIIVGKRSTNILSRLQRLQIGPLHIRTHRYILIIQ